MKPEPSPFPHVVIRASAGTGKTFQLSNRFLGLAAAGFPPDHILATTFARKAAGEILERVLTRLAEAADSDACLIELTEHLQCLSFSHDDCVALLRNLINHLHRLQIGTLDSFFVQMAGSFSLELGLPLGWRIVEALEDHRLRADAIQAVLESHPVTESVRLVHLLGKGEATRSVTRQIEDVVDKLYDLFLDSDESAWQVIPRLKPLEESAIRDALTQLAELDDFPDKRFGTARDKNLQAAAAGDWDAFVDNGLAQKIICGETLYYKKPIEPHVLDAYLPLLAHARAELLNRLANQTAGTQQMLAHFHEAYRQLKTDRRALRFDDVTRSLADGLSDKRVEELAYRLDGPLGHLLLDEFQDTSLGQWKVLLPFAKRVTSNGGSRSFFCVGDAKQAIYGWRGGVAEIFDSASGQLPGVIARSLVESYRSAQPVIDVVNRVFGNLPVNPALDEFRAVTDRWHSRYEEHRTTKTSLAGCCRLHVAQRAEEGEDQQGVTLRFAAEHIACLAKQHPERTIGVLVRRNKAVAPLIFELRSRHEVFASEEGGNPLTDSPAVQLVLSLLKLADHPGDTAARFHVAKSPLGPAVGMKLFDDGEEARRLSLRLRERLVSDGYGRTIQEWVKVLAPDCDLRDLNRLLQLVTLAYRLDDGRVRRPDDFIAEVESQRVEDPTAAKVRVMTVHQAKGLQFDIVVLPELDVCVKPKAPHVVVERDGSVGPIRRVSRYANETIQKLLPAELRPMFADWANPLIGESLCVLYVAMTRAVHALDLIIAPSKANEKTWPKTFAGVVRGALAPGKPAEPETLLFQHGDAAWLDEDAGVPTALGGVAGAGGAAEAPVRGLAGASLRSSPGHPQVEQTIAERLEVKLRLSRRRRRGLDYRTPSALEGGGQVDLRRQLKLESVAGMVRGSILHAWFERIGWLEDGVPDDAELLRLAGQLATPEIDLVTEIKRFRRMFGQPAVATALSKRSRASDASLSFSTKIRAELRSPDVSQQLHRERSFVVRQDDALMFGTIDRVSFFFRGDKLIAADVLDYKTDAVTTPTQIEERTGFYRPQLEAYRSAMSSLTSLALEDISARLLFVEPGVIVPIR
jgi:ATP-dependent helicase/nuclease subunit A